MSLVPLHHPQYCSYCGRLLAEDQRCSNPGCTMYGRLASPPSFLSLFRPRSPTGYLLVVIAVLVLLLVGSGFFALGLLVNRNAQGLTSNGSSDSKSSGTPLATNNSTPTSVAPTPPPPSPTTPPTPSPTPTLPPGPGTVLCKASTGNWQGWQATSGGWTLSGSHLINDGSNGPNGYGINLYPPSTCQPTTQDYSIQATVTPINEANHFNFMLFVRGDASVTKGYAMGVGNLGVYDGYAEGIRWGGPSAFDAVKLTAVNPPNPGSPLTFIAKVVGTHLSLSVRGYPTLSVDDARFPTGEQIGVYGGSQLELDSFQVTVEA